MKFKQFVKRALAGAAIGVGAAIPGVSGAAVAVILKIYEPIIESVNNFRKHFKQSIIILLPILLGIFIAIIPCIWLFDKAFEMFMFGLICIFAGFLVGSVPDITNNVKGTKIKPIHIILCVLGFLLVLGFGFLSAFLGGKIDLNAQFDLMPWWLYLLLVPVGIIAAVALTVPGMSGSLILLILGFYKPLVSHTVSWATDIHKWPQLLGMLGSFALGALIGVVLVSRIMKSLLNKHRIATYWAIIGFIVGSIPTLFFTHDILQYYPIMGKRTTLFSLPTEIIIGVILFGGCMSLSYFLIKYSRRKQIQ